MARRKGGSYIQLNLEGFDELLEKIEKLGGSIQSAVDTCMRQSAQIQQKELKAQMQKSKVDGKLINRMPPPQISWDYGQCTARVGYKKGKYNPDDLSDGYKVVFLNYGTPRREPSQMRALGFLKRAKNKARPQIKKLQEETLNKILGDLSK